MQIGFLRRRSQNPVFISHSSSVLKFEQTRYFAADVALILGATYIRTTLTTDLWRFEMGALTTKGADLLKEVQNLPIDEQKALVQEANKNLPRGDLPKTLLWVILLLGLFAIAIICVVAGANIATDKDSAPFFLIATAVVSGTLGLFASSPTGNK